jgi:anti-sigma factor RsiW
MDSHDADHGLLMAFLAGELGPAQARRWDEHLLECERCWRAVREDRAGRQAAELLRQPAPAGLPDRVRFAVELAVAGSTSPRPPRPGTRLRWRRLTGAGILALGAAVTAVVLLVPGGRSSLPATVAAVARYAETVPQPAQQAEPGTGLRAAPVEVDPPVTITSGGQRIVVRTWRVGGTEAVVAVSGRPFPMPPGAQGMSGRGMAWSARVGSLGLYCVNGRSSELVAARVPAAELAVLAAQLPLA